MSWTYNYIDHTADIAVMVKADSIKELFIASANSWRDMVFNSNQLQRNSKKTIALSEPNLEILLVSFLNELNFLFQSENWVTEILNNLLVSNRQERWYLNVELLGHRFNRSKAEIKTEIKSITYHQLEIKESDGQFSTIIVFDI